MIKTREDLKFYIKEDAKRNRIKNNLFWYWLHLLFGTDHVHCFRYLKCLRHCEYHKNNSGFYHKILFLYYKLKKGRLGIKYSISIPENVVGYGLCIHHMSGGGGVLVNCKQIGNYCGLQTGVLIGNNGLENLATIGDFVAFGPGAKAFGKIEIGNNVFIAANAVVTKDIEDNKIVGGLPAKVIKDREPLEKNYPKEFIDTYYKNKDR